MTEAEVMAQARINVDQRRLAAYEAEVFEEADRIRAKERLEIIASKSLEFSTRQREE